MPAPRPAPKRTPSRSITDASATPMSNRRVLLHFLISLGLFLGVPVVVALFAKLVTH